MNPLRALRFSALLVLILAGPLAAQSDPRIPINAATCPGDASNTYVISTSGSYYLPGNLTAAGAKSCVHVAADWVTIDLNGYSVFGNSAAPYGIYGSSFGAAVRNGFVYSFASAGISLGATSTADNVLVQSNGTGIGISAWTVRNCYVAGAANYGIGTWLAEGCSVLGCGKGYYLNSGGVAHACRSEAATTYGFYVSPGGSVTDCAASRSGIYDYYGFDGTTFTSCTASAFTSGTDTAAGFHVASGCTLVNCTSTSHRGDGFQFASGCLISGCTARGNGVTGAGGTTAHGFHGSGTNNRIDGNHATNNTGTGILSASSTADHTVRNTSYGNGTNYSPSSGTFMGPVSTPSTATSPWANF